jgi:uncharacterized protein (TIGR03118 family)
MAMTSSLFCRLSRAACLGVCMLAACGGDDNNGNSAYSVTKLVADTADAAHVDPNLVNGWGIAFNPTGFVWVADAGTSKSTLYDGKGVPQALVVTIPPAPSGPASPTGIVFNGTADFAVSQGGVTAASPFLFATESGTVAGWSPTVNRTSAITAFDGSATAASYKGLALATSGGANRLYAADFHNNRVDVFDRTFAKVTAAGGFQDAMLPAGYAPFGIQAVGNRIFVAYAQQDALAHDANKGAGLGVLNVFDTDGMLIKRLVTGGPLNAPWGIAMAPADFGTFSSSLLVGNFGDGRINAFDPDTGDLRGTLARSDGTPIVIDGLWGIAFGNGVNDQPTRTLFFAAGPNDETHGLYGRIDPP